MNGAAAREKLPSERDALGPSDFRILAEGRYWLRFDHAGIEFEVDRLRRKSDELVGELIVRTDLAGASTINDRILASSDFNLSSLWLRERHAQFLRKRARSNQLDWLGALEQFCSRVLAASRQGQPAVLLRDTPRPDPAGDDRIVHGFALPRRHAGIIFGDGGGMKSYLALWILGELARQGIRTGLLDWELDAPDHRDRLERLFGADMPDVWYARCERPLLHDVDRLKRIIQDQRLEYVAFDSVGYATHQPPEKAEAALGYFQAVRQFGSIGTLHLAHVARGEGSDDRPFGSTYWHNSARATWFVKPAEEPNAAGVSVGVFERKRNIGAKRQPFGLDVQFTGGRTVIQRINLADVPDLAARLSLQQRIRSLLKAGARSREEIASELDDKPETIRRVINRAIGKGVLIRFPGPAGVEHIGLPTRGEP